MRADQKRRTERGLKTRRVSQEVERMHYRLCSDLTRHLRHWLRRSQAKDGADEEYALRHATVNHLISKFGVAQVSNAVSAGCPDGWSVRQTTEEDEMEGWVFVRAG